MCESRWAAASAEAGEQDTSPSSSAATARNRPNDLPPACRVPICERCPGSREGRTVRIACAPPSGSVPINHDPHQFGFLENASSALILGPGPGDIGDYVVGLAVPSSVMYCLCRAPLGWRRLALPPLFRQCARPAAGWGAPAQTLMAAPIARHRLLARLTHRRARGGRQVRLGAAARELRVVRMVSSDTLSDDTTAV